MEDKVTNSVQARIHRNIYSRTSKTVFTIQKITDGDALMVPSERKQVCFLLNTAVVVMVKPPSSLPLLLVLLWKLWVLRPNFHATSHIMHHNPTPRIFCFRNFTERTHNNMNHTEPRFRIVTKSKSWISLFFNFSQLDTCRRHRHIL